MWEGSLIPKYVPNFSVMHIESGTQITYKYRAAAPRPVVGSIQGSTEPHSVNDASTN